MNIKTGLALAYQMGYDDALGRRRPEPSKAEDMADSIAATLGPRRIGEEDCEIKAVSNFPTSSMTASWGCLCTACGAFHELTRGDGWRYCPSCGKKVKKEGQG